MNMVAISGRITADPELKQVKRGEDETTSYMRFGIAVQTGRDKTDFITVTAFGKTAEFILKYFRKGSRIEVTGELRQNKWVDQGGNSRSEVVVRADRVYFGETKAETEARECDHGEPQRIDPGYYVPPAGAIPSFTALGQDDELPF